MIVNPKIQNRINATALAGLTSAMHRGVCPIPRIPRCPFHDEAKAIQNAEYMLPHYERDMELFNPSLSEWALKSMLFEAKKDERFSA